MPTVTTSWHKEGDGGLSEGVNDSMIQHEFQLRCPKTVCTGFKTALEGVEAKSFRVNGYPGIRGAGRNSNRTLMTL